MTIRIFSNDPLCWLVAALIFFLLLTGCQPQMPPLPAAPAEAAIPVAILLPTSGELATFGQQLRNGMQLAFDEAGQPVEPTVFAADCTFAGGQKAARLALAQGHTLLLGPLCSEAAIAAAIEADAAGALLIAPAAPHPLVTQNSAGRTRPTVFRVCDTAGWQGQLAARFAGTSLQRAAIITSGPDSYATGLANAFEQAFAGEIVFRQNFSPGQTDPADLISAAQQAGAELVYLPTAPLPANQLGPSVLNHGLNLLGSDRWDSPELDRAALQGSSFPLQFNAEATQPEVHQFVERYKSVYAVTPDTLAALGYDAANLLLQAVARAGSPQPDAVSKILETGTFPGVTGVISFDQAHNPRKSITFGQIVDGQLRPLTTLQP